MFDSDMENSSWGGDTENEEIRVANLALRRDFIQQNST